MYRLLVLLAACLALASAAKLPVLSTNPIGPKIFETLDSFQVPSSFLNVNGGGSQPAQAANFVRSPILVGGERDFILSCLGRNNAAYFYEAEIANGTLTAVAQAPNTAITAQVQLQYDGADNSVNLTKNGLNSLNLNVPGMDGFFLDVRFLGGGIAPTGIFEWWAPTYGSTHFAVPADGSGVFIPFQSMPGSANSVGAIQITIQLNGPTHVAGIFFGLYGSSLPFGSSSSSSASWSPAPSQSHTPSPSPSRSPNWGTPPSSSATSSSWSSASRTRTPYPSSSRTPMAWSASRTPSRTRSMTPSPSMPLLGMSIDPFSDSFSQQRFTENGTFPQTAVRISQTSSILGQERDLAVTAEAGAAGYIVTFQNTGGQFVLNVPAGTQAQATLQYDGRDGSMNLDTTGLGGVNFLSSGATQFQVAMSSSRPVTLDISVYSGSSVCSYNSSSSTTSPILVPYTLFTGNCDWQQVGAVELVTNCASGCYMTVNSFRTK